MGAHTCEACGVVFQRTEHLTRHRLIHLGQMPFNCPKCDRAFARRDTLQRHLGVHDKEHERGGASPYIRSNAASQRRVKKACQRCSKSKLRCDGDLPCTRCRSKNTHCTYGNSHPSTEPDPPPFSDTLMNGAEDWSTATDSQALWAAQDGGDSGQGNAAGSQSSPTKSFGDGARGQTTHLDGLPQAGSEPTALCDMPLSTFPGVHHQDETVHLDQSVLDPLPLDMAHYDSSAMDIATGMGLGMSFWDDMDYFPPLYHGPYTEFGFLLTPDRDPQLDRPQDMFPADDESVDSESEAPLPSFLGARSSPDPQEGQEMEFNGFIRQTFNNRCHLQARETREGRQAHAGGGGRGASRSNGRSDKAQQTPPLMGSFPSLLSSGDPTIWEPENLAHVRPIPQAIYDQMVDKYEKLNVTNDQYTQFATGHFPSYAACNAFLQLYFEEFNQLFPFIHQPSFDTAKEPLLLILAVMATGCRFSRVSAAVECVDLLQEFTRRVFRTTMERDYNSTCEPWLAQAGLLNQIGMQFSSDMRLVESAQGLRSVLEVVCRKINCFNEARRATQAPDSQHSCHVAWKAWIRKETMRRLAYTLWMFDSQYVLFMDQAPIIPTALLRVRLPGPESLWHAPNAESWHQLSKQTGTYAPGNIRRELDHLYKTHARRAGLGDFAILLLILGVFRNTLDLWRTMRETHHLQHGTATVDFSQTHNEHGDLLASQDTGTAAATKSLAVLYKAMEHLRTLCGETDEMPSRMPSSLRATIIHHYHAVCIALSIPLGELFCYMGYRVTSVDVTHCRQRLRRWVRYHERDARQMVFHAGRLFAYIRQSDMHGYWEGRAFFLACLSLWIYGDNALNAVADNGGGDNNTTALTSPASAAAPAAPVPAPTIRLDQFLSAPREQAWLQDGAGMRPCLAGVGSILGPDGVARLIQEAARVLCASHTWPLSQIQGKSLHIFHKLRSEAS